MNKQQEARFKETADRAAQILEDKKAVIAERARRYAKRLVESEEQPAHPPLRALTIQELFDRPTPDYLVDQLLPVGALAELVGDSETLKSFVAIHLGMAIATKQSEFFGLQVVKHGPVLYIATEGAGSFQFRLRAWGTAHNVDIRTVPFFTIASPINLRDAGFQRELEQIVSTVRPVVIIVDTLHRCIPGAEENSSRDLGEVVGFATRLQAESGAAVLFLHHPPKSDPSGRGRGSGSLYYAADTEINAVLEGDERADGTKVIVVSVKKQKDDAKVSLTLTNRIVPVLNEHGGEMAYESGRKITSCILVRASETEVAAAKEGPVNDMAQRVMEFVRANPGSTVPEIRSGVKASKVLVRQAIEDLEANKVLARTDVKRGRAWAVEYRVAVEATCPDM